MLVIGKLAKPRAFKTQSLPVIYKSQSHGWISQEVFTEWFRESFEPSVKTFLKKQNLPTNKEQLKSRDSLIEVMFLPPSCT
jgi:hypothetical protein